MRSVPFWGVEGVRRTLTWSALERRVLSPKVTLLTARGIKEIILKGLAPIRLHRYI